MESDQTKSTLTIPLSIVVAGLLIAGAIFFSRGARAPEGLVADGREKQSSPAVAAEMRAVDALDHIRGNPNAKVIIVEYSDLECPFCKSFHPTMKRVMEEYGKDGRVAWVYRHFPIMQRHPKAPKEAEATECAAELGGNTKFWEYTDRLFEVTPSNNGLDPSELPRIAEYVGLKREAFEECLSSGRHTNRVQRDYEDGIAAGTDGTPFSVVIGPDGKKSAVRGAQPYAILQGIIDGLLR